MKKLTTSVSLFICLLILVSPRLRAQKLPAEQKAAIRAPANIVIDGKATEWANKFQAYSNHTQFAYTISNDDKNLYLTVQADDPAIIKHIINGGISFTVNKSGKKNDKGGVQITYPLIPGFLVSLKNPRARFNNGVAPVTEGDSLMTATNQRMNDKSKEIKVAGIKGVDTLISVYNADGIKAAAAFDNKMVYTLEIAISLNDLELSVNGAANFVYQVRINETESRGITIIKNAEGVTTGINITGTNPMAGQAATDFWGEYTLAK